MHKLNLFARLFCGVAVAAGAAIAGQPASTVAVAWDRPLAEQLPTGSRDVIVKRLGDPGLPVLPSGPLSFAEAIEVARDFSAAVVVVELTQVEAHLAERATWIHTKMNVRVAGVPFARDDTPIRVSDQISVTYPEGETLIGDVRVRTADAIPVSVGQRCLMFLAPPSSDGPHWSVRRIYGILSNNTLLDRHGKPVTEGPAEKPVTLERMATILRSRR